MTMRIFTTSCIDNETNMEMVLSDCSYNSAAFWLIGKGFTEPKVESVDSRFTRFSFTEPSKIKFMYDEHRGYLLRERI